MKILNIPQAVYLYNEGIEKVNFKELKDFIHQTFGRIKVSVVRLEKKVVATRGLLFDFVAAQKTFKATKFAHLKDTAHIILTPKLFATFDEQKKLHIRAAIFSFPSIISTSGIIEGPAKPQEYYLYKQRYLQLGVWNIEEVKLKRRFGGRFIDYQDKRINEVLKGYVAQALFFYITGEPFCKKNDCRLYNAHWQEELIYCQVKIKRFCKDHQRLLKKIKKNAYL